MGRKVASLTLPWPPQVNHYYAVYRGRKILSKKGREYKKAVSDLVLEAKLNHLHLSGSIFLKMFAYMPDKRKRDLSNIIKPLEDAMVKAGMMVDDEIIDKLCIVRIKRECHDKKGGCVFVRLEKIVNVPGELKELMNEPV